MAYHRSTIVTRVQALLQATPCATLTQVCEALGADRHTVERACREETGGLFKDLKRAARFEQVCQLLVDPVDNSLKSVAFHSGFSSPASFSRFVRSNSGLTPMALRTQLLSRRHVG